MHAPALLTTQSPPAFLIEKTQCQPDVRTALDTTGARADVSIRDMAATNRAYATPIRYNLGLLPLVATVDLNLPSHREIARNATRQRWGAAPIEDAEPGLTIGDQTILLGPLMR